MRSALALVFVLATWTLVGCGDSDGPDPAPAAEVTAGDAAVRLVEEDRADLVLWVSNQSFDDEKVRLTIAIDGVTVVEGDFYVEGQHNWIKFPLSMSAGPHEVTALADSGAKLKESFEMPGDKPRYGLIDHWGKDDSAELTWLIQRRQLAFA